MTRISIALVAALALAVCACERQPLDGDSLVTHTHGSNGDPKLESAHHTEHTAEAVHPAPAGKQEGQAATATPAPEKPAFFPTK